MKCSMLNLSYQSKLVWKEDFEWKFKLDACVFGSNLTAFYCRPHSVEKSFAPLTPSIAFRLCSSQQSSTFPNPRFYSNIEARERNKNEYKWSPLWMGIRSCANMFSTFLRHDWENNWKAFLFLPKHKERYPVNVPMQPILLTCSFCRRTLVTL